MLGAAELDNCGWFAKLVYIIIPMLRPTLVNLLVLSFIGKMMMFDLVWIMTGGGPLWSTETVSTYVYKRAFDWNTFDLGYPSAIAVLWFFMILIFVAADDAPPAPARPAGVLDGAALGALARPSPAHAACCSFSLLYTLATGGPFLWVAAMSLRTTPEIFANPYALPATLHWEKFAEAWVSSNYGTYFWNSTDRGRQRGGAASP